jgi:hypothetical protein
MSTSPEESRAYAADEPSPRIANWMYIPILPVPSTAAPESCRAAKYE